MALPTHPGPISRAAPGAEHPTSLQARARKVRAYAAAVGHPEVSVSLYDYAAELETRAKILASAPRPGEAG
jgi:hypothetical protein